MPIKFISGTGGSGGGSPEAYEYAFIEPFTSSTVPAINGDYEFNAFGDNQLRAISGITVNTNSFTLAQDGMFKVEASIKPNTTATGATDYGFHDGSSFIGKIGTLAVDGGSKALDVHAIAFINTSTGSKTITLKTQAGNTGFAYDANGTAITIQRVAG